MPRKLILLCLALGLGAQAHSEAGAYTYQGGALPHGSQAYLMNSGERIVVPPGASVPADIQWKPGAPRNARRIYLGEDPKTLPPNTCLYLDQAMMKQRSPAPASAGPHPLRSAVDSPTGESVKAQLRSRHPQLSIGLSTFLDLYLAQPRTPKRLSSSAASLFGPPPADDAHDQAVQDALRKASQTRPTPASK